MTERARRHKAAPPPPAPTPTTGPEALAALAWLAGCWQSERFEAGSMEQWMPPAGDAMLGASRTLRNGRMVAHEFLRIELGDDGHLRYIALPSGQRETAFTLVAAEGGEWCFENLAHDFPRRIRYRREAGQRLLARIEGQREGLARVLEFPMRRVPVKVAAKR